MAWCGSQAVQGEKGHEKGKGGSGKVRQKGEEARPMLVVRGGAGLSIECYPSALGLLTSLQ